VARRLPAKLGEKGQNVTEVQKALQSVDLMVLACKAKGGWKYRNQIRLSDRELEVLLADAERRLRLMAVALTVAKGILKEPAPSTHPRWEEYRRRFREAAAELGMRSPS